MVQFCFPVLAAMTLQKILFAGLDKATLLKKLKPALYTTGAILGIMIVCYFTFSYSAAGDKAIQDNFTKGMLQQQGAGNPGVQQQAQEFGKSFITAIREDRRSLFGKDLLRTFLLIAAAGGLIYFFIQKRISPKFVLVGVLILSSFDLFAVGDDTLMQGTSLNRKILKVHLLPHLQMLKSVRIKATIGYSIKQLMLSRML
jgi:hypothetical protein